MQSQLITREQVVKLTMTMPLEKLTSWYQYGLFIQKQPLPILSNTEPIDDDLKEEFAMWEAASAEDWTAFEVALEGA